MTTRKTAKKKRWSHDVMKKSNALDLEDRVFTWSIPRRIALSLKHSAEASTRRKARPFQSAMSMLNFHINRGGENIQSNQDEVVTWVKEGVREVVGELA